MLAGIDVSKWQTTTPALKDLSFVFARASIGLTPDAMYSTHIAKAKAAGLVTGAYHYNWGSLDPIEQADYFLAHAIGADLLALDVEGAEGFTLAQTRAFISRVHAAGRKIGLYHSDSGFLLAGQDWNWVAKWSTIAPVRAWTFWQWQGSPLDKDYFNGTLADLLRLANQTTQLPVADNQVGLPMTLKANAASPVQTLVGVQRGDWVYRLDGTRLIQWSANYTVTSLGGSGIYDLIVVTTSKVTQYALVLTAQTSNRRPVGTTTPPVPVPVPKPTPPPPAVVLPAPTITPISTTPEHIAANMWVPPGPFATPPWTAGRVGIAWVAEPANPTQTFILVGGGPAPLGQFEGMDNLANRLAAQGARGIAVDYPNELGTQWADALAPLQAALAIYPDATVVAHSLGGYFGSILAYTTPFLRRLVLVAADDLIGEQYRTALGGPLVRDLMRSSDVPVTVIAGSYDPVTTVAETQNLVNALNATGHPGRFLVIDGADHDSILGDANVIAAILA